MDRTEEFARVAKVFAGTNESLSKRRIDPTAFTTAARRVSYALLDNDKLIAQLERLVSEKGLFADPTAEIGEISAVFKRDTETLNKELEALVTFCANSLRSSRVRQRSKHCDTVVTYLKRQLAKQAKAFQAALQARTGALKEQSGRRGRFTAQRANPLVKEDSPLFQQQQRQRRAPMPPALATVANKTSVAQVVPSTAVAASAGMSAPPLPPQLAAAEAAAGVGAPRGAPPRFAPGGMPAIPTMPQRPPPMGMGTAARPVTMPLPPAGGGMRRRGASGVPGPGAGPSSVSGASAGAGACAGAGSSVFLPRPGQKNTATSAVPGLPGLASNPYSAQNEQAEAEARSQSMAQMARSRMHGMAQVESQIAEMGSMFTKMATLVHEQGETVTNIYDDVDESLTHVQSGQSELLKYYNTISKDRQLIIKLFGVLFFIIILMTYFM